MERSKQLSPEGMKIVRNLGLLAMKEVVQLVLDLEHASDRQADEIAELRKQVVALQRQLAKK